MIKIAHRGNINGPSSEENQPHYIWETASRYACDVEIDTWFVDNKWYFGHDMPQYETNFSFLNAIKNFAWIHCKNLEALKELDPKEFNFFWHQQDDFTLTSKNYIWTYPEKNITNKSIIVDLDLKDLEKYKNSYVYGVCTDYPSLIE